MKRSEFSFAWFLYRKDERLGSGLLLLILSLAFGVAALVSLDIFTRRIGATIQRDSKALMAADYKVTARRPFSDGVFKALAAEIARGDVIRQDDFVSSLSFSPHAAKSAGAGSGSTSSLTVSVRALAGEKYPFYGVFETRPKIKIQDLAQRANVVLDQSFEARGVRLGDKVRLGSLDFEVAAFLVQEPQTIAGAFELGPRIIIHQNFADATGLTGRGARVFRQLLVRSELNDVDFKKQIRAHAPEPHWRILTPDRANRQAERIIGRIRGFLSFVGLTGLFLGGVGLFMIFRSQFLLKLGQFLTLRCLGVSRRSLIWLALLRATIVGLIGCTVGSALGFAVERYLSNFARQSLEMNLHEVSAWPSFVYGGLLALAVGAVAAVLPLREVLRVPVSQAMRQDEAQQLKFRWQDAAALLILSVALTLVVNRDVKLSFVFLGGLVAASTMLVSIGFGLGFLLQPFSRLGGFVVRHSLLSLIRKPARSQLLLVSLGVGLFLLESVVWIAISLRQQLDFAQREGIPNVFFLNVAEADLPALNENVAQLKTVPITQGRFTEIEAQAVTEETVPEDGEERFYQTREYVVTRRSKLGLGERLVKGDAMFAARAPGSEVVRASLEERFAKSINLSVGSQFKMDIAGVAIDVRVDSLRAVDWFNFQPNFFIVFNESDMAEAPMDYVAFARVDAATIPQIQRRVGERIPQVSVLDGDAIGRRLSDLLSKLSFSVFSLSLFSLGSCVFVFVGMTLARVREFKKDIALWKCLGVTAPRIRALFVLESTALVLAACAAALLASALAVTVVCRFALDIPVEWPGWLFIAVAAGVAPTVFGLLSLILSNSLIKMNPAQIWRELES